MDKHCAKLPTVIALAILLIVVAGGSTSAMATALTYSVSDTASGFLGPTPFTDAMVTVSASGDSGNVMCGGGFCELDILTSATVTIAGLGTANFTDVMFVFDNQPSQVAGIGDNTCVGCRGSVLDTTNAVFGAYDLQSPIGPISGPVFFRPDLRYGTDMGLLQFTSAGDTSTFTASGEAVPEPASLMLLGTGLVSVVGFARRRL